MAIPGYPKSHNTQPCPQPVTHRTTTFTSNSGPIWLLLLQREFCISLHVSRRERPCLRTLGHSRRSGPPRSWECGRTGRRCVHGRPVASHPVRVGMADSRLDVVAAVDVHYLRPDGARAAAVTAGDPAFSAIQAEWTVLLPAVLPYQPGRFFLRELPPLRAVLAHVRNLALLVLDGYVDLDPGGRPGLGAHAHAEFGVPVIGVAKTRFRSASHAVKVLRGNSSRPAVRHRGRTATGRGHRSSPADGRAVPAARRTAPGRRPGPHRTTARRRSPPGNSSEHDTPSALSGSDCCCRATGCPDSVPHVR